MKAKNEFSLMLLAFVLISLFFSVSIADDEILKIHSGIYQNWQKPFLLKQDDLRRIYIEMQETSDKIAPPTKVVIRVGKKDHSYYETTDLETVLNDPNTNENPIQTIILYIRITDPQKVRDPWESDYYSRIAFFTEDNASNSIEANMHYPDQNITLHYFDQIRPLITATFRTINLPRWLLDILLLSLIVLITRICLGLARKYHYLQDINLILTAFLTICIIGFIVIVFDLSGLFKHIAIGRMFRFLQSNSGICWGINGESIIKHSQTQTQVLWGLVIAFIVSLAANVLTHKYFSRKEKSSK